MIWQTSNDASTWTTMATPSTYNVEFEDLDNDSYRSVVSGNLMRNRITPRWAKISMGFNAIDDTTCNQIASAVNNNPKFYFRGLSPAFGNIQSNKWIQFRAYVSQFSCETVMTADGIRWNMSFNVVQAEKGDWQ